MGTLDPVAGNLSTVGCLVVGLLASVVTWLGVGWPGDGVGNGNRNVVFQVNVCPGLRLGREEYIKYRIVSTKYSDIRLV